MKRFFSLKNHIAFLRRQPEQIQHIYVGLFSAAITGLIAAAILYYDYGFWRDQYRRDENTLTVIANPKESIVVQSPGDMFQGFLQEAGEKFKTLGASGTSLLENKEVYTKDESQSQ